MKKIKDIISLLGSIGAITSISIIAFNQKPIPGQKILIQLDCAVPQS